MTPPPPEHPRATAALVLGILGLVFIGVLGPVAWYVGSRTLREITAEPERWSGSEKARVGQLLGVVGTILLVLLLCALGGLVALMLGSEPV